jgi:AraC-like DNA-binding protein
MSTSSFHPWFRETTGVSRLQYQQQLGLQETRIKSHFPKRLDFAETQSGSKKSRPANEAKATNIDQDRAIRFVHEVLCAAQKRQPGERRESVREEERVR